MNNPSTLYFRYLAHNKQYLIQEVEQLFPNWQLERDFDHIVTFTVPREYSLEEICELPLSFALGKGKFISEGDEKSIDLSQVLKDWETENIHHWDTSGVKLKMGDRKTRGHVIDCFHLGQGRVLVGARFQVRGDFAPYAGTSPIPGNEQAPSYDYQCLAESFKRFRPLVAHDEVFLDVNGANEPGRAYFLLEKGFRVIGVGHDKLPELVTSNEDYLHLYEDFLNLSHKKFRGFPPIDWGVAKLGVHDTNILEHLLDLLLENDESKGLMLTFSIKGIDDLNAIKDIVRLIKETSFSHVRTGQVPSHQEEFSLVATRHVGTSIIRT